MPFIQSDTIGLKQPGLMYFINLHRQVSESGSLPDLQFGEISSLYK
jgi:hypothetical protein